MKLLALRRAFQIHLATASEMPIFVPITSYVRLLHDVYSISRASVQSSFIAYLDTIFTNKVSVLCMSISIFQFD